MAYVKKGGFTPPAVAAGKKAPPFEKAAEKPQAIAAGIPVVKPKQRKG